MIHSFLFLRRLGVDDLGPETMLDVAQRVAVRHGVSMSDLRRRTRNPKDVPARIEAMARCYALGKSNRQVARFFNRKDHTTVVNARHRFAAMQAAE